MVARGWRILVIGLAASTLAWWLVGSWLQLAWPWRALGVVMLLAPHAVILAAEFCAVLVLGEHRRSSEPAPSPRQLAAAWWCEVVADWAVFAWRLPFLAPQQPDFANGHGHHGRRGVVLIHGFLCNRGLWSRWAATLRREGVPFVAVDLEPVFGSIDDYVQTIDKAVTRVERATGLPVLIVAHSMGGLAARAWLQRFDADSRIDGVFTIGTPHRGTRLARLSTSRNGRQMRVDNPWLRTLAASEPPERLHRFVCFFGNCDNVVQPFSSATLPGADNRHLPGTAHVAMVDHAAVIAAALEQLRAPSGIGEANIQDQRPAAGRAAGSG